jgi:phage-related protein
LDNVIVLDNFAKYLIAVMEEFIRDIFYYEDYYLEFYESLKPSVKKKFNWTLELIATIEKVPEKYFKYITDSTGLFEVRVEVGSDIFRVFSFFDKGNLIILVNGFQKKTQKTPKNEIELAEKLKKQYYDGKDNS